MSAVNAVVAPAPSRAGERQPRARIPRYVLALGALVAVLAIVPFLPTLNNGFVDWDDEKNFVLNAHFQGWGWAHFRWAWTTYHGTYWMPLSWLSLQGDAELFSRQGPDGRVALSPAAFHGQNLLWHGATALLLFGLWKRLTGAMWQSFFLAALFVAQPLVTLAGRGLLRFWFDSVRRRGLNPNYMLVIGTGALAQAFADRVEAHRGLGLRVVGHLTVPGADVDEQRVSRPILGSVNDLAETFRSKPVDEVAVCLPPGAAGLLDPIVSIAADTGDKTVVPAF